MSEDLAYSSYALHPTHPDHLAAVASLLGMSPPPVEQCRVLDLGCASGGNLIPMATALPGAELVGVDLSEAEIARGQAIATELGLDNLDLHALDVREVGDRFGAFDYIIAHGLFSWVPTDCQDAVLQLCSEQLAPQGVAYLGHNTLPGWGWRGMFRQLLATFVDQELPVRARVDEARRWLSTFGELVTDGDGAFPVFVRAELERIAQTHDSYLEQEFLTTVNQPVLFRDLMRRTSSAGLAFLADAEGLNPSITGAYYPRAAALMEAAGDDLLAVEQLLDFATNRSHRSTLLCHAGVELDREVHDGRVGRFLLATDLAPPPDAPPPRDPTPVVFSNPWGVDATIGAPLVKSALTALARTWPARLPFDALCDQTAALLGTPLEPAERRALEVSMVVCYGTRLVQLHTRPLQVATQPGQRPVACPAARALVAQGVDRAPSRTHHAHRVDAFDRALLTLLDGTRTQAQLHAELVDLVRGGRLELHARGRPVTGAKAVGRHLRRRLPIALSNLARAGFLVG